MNNPNLSPAITDRTAQDVATRTEKGFYNVSDIQRINSYVEYLSDVLGLNLIVEDVSLWYVASDTPQTPIAVNWDYVKANNIEKILKALDEFYQSVQIDKIYSGTFRAGNHIKFRGA